MHADKPIDDLIRAGWEVIETDYHAVALHNWRQKAFDCLVQLLGPDHMDTQYFEHHIRQFEKENLIEATSTTVALTAERESAKPRGRSSGDN
jgi:hypothetical protein